jgi:hypothetical protein
MSASDETRFNEADLAELIRVELQKVFLEYRVDKGISLLYKLHFDGVGRLCPDTYQTPTRGQLAFETDILIRDSKVPLVALELKFGHFTTHDVLTYSTKAIKHKELYPYLRYGFVVGGIKKIQNRFFTHNAGFDFAFVFADPSVGIPKLIDIVRRQIKIAERIKAVGESEVSSFETFIDFN